MTAHEAIKAGMAAVRNWEQRRRQPDPLARLYLHNACNRASSRENG